MTKARRISNCVVVAVLLITVSILSACGSGEVANGNSTNATAGSTNSANVGTPATKPKDTSPVTTTITDIFAETDSSSATSVMEKYMGREMTITGGVLYEIESDSSKVGKGQNTDFTTQSTSPQYFVTCKGKPPVYSPESADNVAKYRNQGQAQPFTVKGNFKEAGSYSNKHWIILDPCVMTKAS